MKNGESSMKNFMKNWLVYGNDTTLKPRVFHRRIVSRGMSICRRCCLFHNLACHFSERIFKFKIDHNALPYLYSHNFPLYKSLFFFISSNKRSYGRNAHSISFLKFELCNRCYMIDNKKWSSRNIANNGFIVVIQSNFL